MSKKIVFFDIDGTIFDNHNNIVHKSTIDAIKKLKENDVYVCIASGRSKIMAEQVFKRFDLSFDGYVMINGQVVILNDEVIYKNPLNKQFINEFVDTCNQLGLPYGFVTLDGYMVSSHHRKVIKAFEDFKIKIPRVTHNDDYNEEIFQGLFFDFDYIDYFTNKFKKYVKFIPWLENGADIIPVNSSKAIGIEKLCEKLNVSRDNIYAIGDSTNDLEMIQYAKYGIAMGNAKPDLKKIADYVTDDIDKDGLANALKYYKLI